MATKPAQNHDADTLPPAMDYAMHERTYGGFINFFKWTVISLAALMVSLFCFIEAEQPILGLLLLGVSIIVIPFWAMVSGRR